MIRRQNDYQITGDIALITLTQDKTAIIDVEDLEKVLAYKWAAQVVNKNKTTENYYVKHCFRVGEKKKCIYLHRFLLNEPLNSDVDHKNNNALDCRKSNLRVASRSQNLINRTFKNKSGYRGVWEFKNANNSFTYRAQITLNKIPIKIGLFNSPVDAALAYDNKARQLHGEFARLNFPRIGEQGAKQK